MGQKDKEWRVYPKKFKAEYQVTINTLLNNLRIEPLEFCAGIGRGEPPIYPLLFSVPLTMPCGQLSVQGFYITNAP
jgi:hypothetical protein